MPKGDEGTGTGGAARAAIRKAMNDGLTQAEIGAAVGRDESTISDILTGSIQNPPEDLIPQLQGLGGKKKKKKKKRSTMKRGDEIHRAF